MGAFDFQTHGFNVSGFADLYANLDGLTLKQKQQDLGPLLVKALTPMSLVAISLAPDDPETPPPYDLKSSIKVGTRQRSGRRNRAQGKYGARAYMGPTKEGYPQAMFAEFGTGERFHKDPVKSVGMMRAVPYMRPAWDAGRYGALEIIKAGFAETVFNSVKKRFFKLR